MARRILQQFGRHFDILIMAATSLFIGGMAWAAINGKVEQNTLHLTQVDTTIQQQNNTMNQIQQSSARTEQEVDDIAGDIKDIKQWLRDKK